MQESDLVLLDGEILSREEAARDIFDRGGCFGDGVCALTPVYNGRCFALLPHMEQLFESVIAVKIPMVYMMEELVDFHEQLLAATGEKDCLVYTQITRGSGPFDLAFPEPVIPGLFMFTVPVDREALAERRKKGANLVTKEDMRWQRLDINNIDRLPEVLAKQEAVVSRAFDALFVRDGKLTETTESSFFIYKDGILWTYPEGPLIRKNITRRLLKERLAPDLGLQIVERAFDKDFAVQADEAFICSPAVEFMPVTKLDRAFINEGKPGPLAQKLQQAYMDFVLKECPSQHEA